VRKIAVLNQKGGVGKTTTVVNVSAALALKGRRVLVIDLDPQAHLTIHLGADQDPDAPGVYEVLTGNATMGDAVRRVRDNLWLLGASIDLVGAEAELVNEVGREIILAQAAESVQKRFDLLIIDCPPSLGLLALNALAAVDEVIIPIQPHFLALQGFSRLLQTVTLVQSRINPALCVSAILMCMFDSRTSLSNEVREDIKRFLSSARDSKQPWSEAQVIPVHIRRNIKLAEAPSHGQTIFEYEPQCNGAADYEAVANFLAGAQKDTHVNLASQEEVQMNLAEDIQEDMDVAVTPACESIESTDGQTPKSSDHPESFAAQEPDGETGPEVTTEQTEETAEI
jgi:chromosome partitioning protein